MRVGTVLEEIDKLRALDAQEPQPYRDRSGFVLPSRRVTRTLHSVIFERGRPEGIRMDNVLNASAVFVYEHRSPKSPLPAIYSTRHFTRLKSRGLPR